MNPRGEIGAWRHIGSPMAMSPPPNGRSASNESDGGAAFTFRSSKARFLEFECGSGAWARE
jgi:hypothetical protein